MYPTLVLLTCMSLPPELIHRILNYLRHDRKSLMVASLVSKAWTSCSQAYLFESVHLKPSNLQRWLKNIPHNVDGPASHTRTLTLDDDHRLLWINPQCSDFPLSNLASFCDVRSLSLRWWNIAFLDDVSPEPYFDHFGRSLRTLSLQYCILDPTTFLVFLSLFPNVQDLEITSRYPHTLRLDTIPDIPKVTPSFCGTLSLVSFDSRDPILRALVALPLHFTTISIQGCAFDEPDTYRLLLTSCLDTLATLRFEKDYRGALGSIRATRPICPKFPTPLDRLLPDVSLASCDKLEEVHALLRNPGRLSQSLINLLSSITKASKNILNIHEHHRVGSGLG